MSALNDPRRMQEVLCDQTCHIRRVFQLSLSSLQKDLALAVQLDVFPRDVCLLLVLVYLR
jgi:hypothetical protein